MSAPKTAAGKPTSATKASHSDVPVTIQLDELFEDRVKPAIEHAIKTIKDAHAAGLSGKINDNLEGYLNHLTNPQPSEKIAETNTARHKSVPFRAQNKRDREAALAKRSVAIAGAEHDWISAHADWKNARSQYALDMSNAKHALEIATEPPKTTFISLLGDSPSRKVAHHHTMRGGVAAAMQDYLTAVGTAGGNLAGGASALLSAFATLIAALNAAQAQYLTDVATADDTMWQSIDPFTDPN